MVPVPLALLLVARLLVAHATVAEPVVLVSARSDGAAGNGASYPIAMAADGTVLFDSDATDLTPEPPRGTRQVYVSRHGVVTLVSRAVDGGRANGESVAAAISADGRIVAFLSTATNLLPGLSNPTGSRQLFLADIEAGSVRIVSHAHGDGSRGGNGPVYGAMLSDDGSVVAFYGTADDIAPNDGFGYQVFSWDAGSGVRTESVTTFGLGAIGVSVLRGLSSDGRWVLFETPATNLAPGVVDGNSTQDVFLRDRTQATTRLVTHRQGDPMRAADGESRGAVLSADGRHVLFATAARDIAPGAGFPFRDVFRWSRESGDFDLVSHAHAGPDVPGRGFSEALAISADGGRAVYRSESTTIVPEPDENGAMDVFVWDGDAGISALVTRRRDGAAAGKIYAWNHPWARLSEDGETIAFSSNAGEQSWTIPDANEATDVFVYDVRSRVVRPISLSHDGTRTAGAATGLAALSRDGDGVLMGSTATNLSGAADANGAVDAFLYRRPPLLVDGFEG